MLKKIPGKSIFSHSKRLTVKFYMKLLAIECECGNIVRETYMLQHLSYQHKYWSATYVGLDSKAVLLLVRAPNTLRVIRRRWLKKPYPVQ